MKLKLLLFFLVVLGFCKLGNTQTTKPYTHLLITEAVQSTTEHNYFEITNMGTETIDLANFEFGHIGGWDGGTSNPWPQVGAGTASPKFFRLPSKTLAPGQSFVMAVASDYNPTVWKKDPANFRERVTVKDFYDVQKDGSIKTIADLLVYHPEKSVPASTDKITPYWNALEGWGGREAYFLRHHWLKEDGIAKDSAVIDQVGGTFDDTNGQNTKKAHDVAGVKDATFTCVLIRRNSVKTGNLDFNAGRGTDYEDSEWIPVPILGGYDFWGSAPWHHAFWTVGNQVNAVLDANTLKSKTGKVIVDLNASTITVPWGVRRDDSLMYQFEKKPGLAWGYDYSPNSEDSSYVSARTGDVLKLYVCGDVVTTKNFTINVLPPAASANIVVPKNSFDYTHMHQNAHPTPFGGMRITDGVSPIDSITNLAYATRVDTLLKYLEKPAKATWKIIFKSGVAQPDLQTGDKLEVKAENGAVKEYFIKLEKFVPASNALLASITWPDMPESFKGAVASTYGWKGDTIPGFVGSNKNYIVQVPLDYNGIPALAYTKQQLDSKVVVKRAKNTTGSVEDRTVTFTVTAENDTVISTYTVRFDKEKDPANVQPFIAEPFFSQYVFRADWSTSFLEIANPGTEILDLSNYMITTNWGPENPGFTWNNATTEWKNRYLKYVPGKKWQDEANWQVQPRILVPDNAVNALVYPGDVFVMAHMTNCNGFTTADKFPYSKEMDINFGMVPSTVPGYVKLSNPWGEELNGTDIPNAWCNNSIYLYKILNDSVKNGLKPATDRNDFELLDSFGGLNGNNWKPDGFDAGSQQVGFTRKPSIYKGNPEPNGSFNDDKTLSEWTHQRPADFSSYNLGWPWTDIAVCTGIGSVTLDEITIYRSTVKSNMYKVSEGYSMNETIRGVKTNTTVSDFYNNIIKANALQTLTVNAAAGGAKLADDAILSNGDVLTVLSADSTNTSKYVLEVSANGLSSNTLLTSTQYTITSAGATGTVEGFNSTTKLRDVVAGVTVPAGATFNVVDANDAYMSLVKLNYDTAYVDVRVSDQIFFEVIAENGINTTLYQLKPTVNASDAYVTSDVYSVDQFASVIQFIPNGTSVHSLLSNVYPVSGATLKVYDKLGFVRLDGDIYKDDKLVVTSADGKNTKVYYFSMLNFKANLYLAYVISDSYVVNQMNLNIAGAAIGTSVAEFVGKLYPSFGATVKVVGNKGAGSENTGNLASGDVLVVTAADGVTTATYKIDNVTGISAQAITSNIKMYPNPTTGRVIVQGLAKGNRVQVFNASGVTLRDVVVDNATDYVSLEAQPAGIYIFVVSNGTQHINIQKIVKK
ncbi:MAG: T9SS type A sorting domain-containing protein [Candidatus Saccharibacteria bacterium]